MESVNYVFEVKSTLDANEIKTTIQKFQNFKSIGGTSPTVLFSFSSDIKGSELLRYKKSDLSFFTNPTISVFCVSGKCYYYKETTEHYLKDHLPVGEFIKRFKEKSSIDIDNVKSVINKFACNDGFLDTLSRSEFALFLKSSMQLDDATRDMDQKKLNINGVEYDEIKFKRHKWIGVEASDNAADLSFLSGISNTLSKGNFGNYLLNDKVIDVKVFSVCYEDMWGNISLQDFDEDGIKYNTNDVEFTFLTSKEENKITFKKKGQ